MSDTILSINGVSKSFPGVKALTDVTFNVQRGSVHALLGENGAGKSTLIKIISGIYKPDNGSISINGEAVSFQTPFAAQKAGVSVVHQEIKLVDTLTVAENIFLGKLSPNKIFVDWSRVQQKAGEMITGLGVNIDPNTLVGDLTVSQQQIVEICKALTNDAKIMILDEPSATLTQNEIQILFDTIKKLKQQGITIVYISHRLEEIFEICDRLTILRDGCVVSTKEILEVDRSMLISMMVGRELKEEFPKFEVPIGEVVLEAKNICRGKILKDISFNLRKGEILGISGLVGSGRTELMRALLGVDKRASGDVYLKGELRNFRKFKEAIDAQIGFVPEDRKRQGLVLNMSVKHNITLAAMRKNSIAGFISEKMEQNTAVDFIKKLKIATPTENTEVISLSGGNQQKVVLSKWLYVDAEIIIVDEPTRGIDVGAKSEIYKLLNQLAAEGKSVIMVSSDMPELIGLCDRIYVMHEGVMKGVLDRENFSQEKILHIAMA